MERKVFTKEEIRQRLALFQELVQSSSSVCFWTYEIHDGRLPALPTPPVDDLREYFFRYSKAWRSLQYYLDHTKERQLGILTNEVSLQWICDFYGDACIVMGPIYMNESSPRQMRRIIDSQTQPVDIRKRVFEALDDIPTIPSNVLFQLALMLHCCLTGSKAAISDIQRPRVPEKTKTPLPKEREEQLSHAGVLQVEKMLLDAVRTGSMDFQSALDSASLVSSGVRMKGTDNLRAGKDSIITLIALASRAAISGGLPADIAYTMSDTYITAAENCADLGEGASLVQTILSDYASRVHAYRSGESYSRPVRQCMDAIDMNLTRKVSLESLAKACGYTTYYLSRKFRQETGETIAQYTQRKKIEASAKMLTDTDLPVQEICSLYQFNSPSYYTMLFQRYMNETPTSYREKQRGASSR